MKTLLVLAAVMGFSVSIAAAECAGHKPASASVDTETKVASVVKQVPPTPVDEARPAEPAAQQ